MPTLTETDRLKFYRKELAKSRRQYGDLTRPMTTVSGWGRDWNAMLRVRQWQRFLMYGIKHIQRTRAGRRLQLMAAGGHRLPNDVLGRIYEYADT